jgi:hypothetical protein
MTFNALEYTRDSLAKELYLIELHSKDGSAVDGGCTCIEEKHLLGIEGLAEEGIVLATDKAEKDYYEQVAAWARKTRKEILDGDFKVAGNPRTRAFLPHGLTECELSHGDVRKKLSGCIKQTEIKCCGKHTTDYSQCECNPVAVCRAAIPCPS